MIGYLIYKFAQRLALLLPRRMGYLLACMVADLWWLLAERERRAIDANLAIVISNCSSRKVFHNFAKYLVDFFRFQLIDKNWIEKNVTIENGRYLDCALAMGKGAIVVAAHLGNWELGGIVLAILGYKFNAVVLGHSHPKITELFTRQRAMKGVKVIPVGIAVRRCFEALRRGEIVALLGDRDFSGHGLRVEFFGREANLIPRGPAVFSLKSGSPIVPGFLLREQNERFRLVFEPHIAIKSSGDLEGDVNEITYRIVKVLERYIALYPEQWYMYAHMWK